MWHLCLCACLIVCPFLPGFDTLGDLLKPTVPSHNQAPPLSLHTGGKLLANDLDSSLANLVGNLQFGGTPAKKYAHAPVCVSIFRPDMQWNQPMEKKLTGGTNWQSKTMSSTTAWNPAPMPPAPMPVQHVAPAPMAFPMTTPQVPVYGMVPPHMGQMSGVPVMTPQPMMYNQPVLRPTNPFAPIPGAQDSTQWNVDSVNEMQFM
ncbi:phosphatidylinositol-binding clathrin assembly protein isoform X2 [Alosa sapidissima]|uniref:phosphatidylinositol-binding clathrin assembly protein isoform X2 n=1 Tax=Alosa sapidissima TaxID=34773 RepID=UPI001C07F372|nr:phosphatidylinositol-binding clathrin assembly protein isoform X2 [Alosa sapidissima]